MGPGDIAQLVPVIQQLITLLTPVLHPNLIVGMILNDSVGMILRMWFGFVLQTTDVETAGDFTTNATIREFEPPMQAVADAALVLAAMWASYRIMWGHGVRSQFTARVMLPRLFMGAVLVNFAMPMLQAAVGVSNTISGAVIRFGCPLAIAWAVRIVRASLKRFTRSSLLSPLRGIVGLPTARND